MCRAWCYAKERGRFEEVTIWSRVPFVSIVLTTDEARIRTKNQHMRFTRWRMCDGSRGHYYPTAFYDPRASPTQSSCTALTVRA